MLEMQHSVCLAEWTFEGVPEPLQRDLVGNNGFRSRYQCGIYVGI